jgi:hypothetical protein
MPCSGILNGFDVVSISAQYAGSSCHFHSFKLNHGAPKSIPRLCDRTVERRFIQRPVQQSQPRLCIWQALRLRGYDGIGSRRALRQAQGRHPIQSLRTAIRIALVTRTLRSLQPDALGRRPRHGGGTGDRSARGGLWSLAGVSRPAHGTSRQAITRKYNPSMLRFPDQSKTLRPCSSRRPDCWFAGHPAN